MTGLLNQIHVAWMLKYLIRVKFHYLMLIAGMMPLLNLGSVHLMETEPEKCKKEPALMKEF